MKKIIKLIKADNIRKFILLFSVNISGKLLFFVFTIMAASTLTPSEFGVFQVCFSALFLLTRAGDFGLGVLSTREIPRIRSDLPQAGAIARRYMKFGGGLSLGVAVLLVIVTILFFRDSIWLYPLLVTALIVPFRVQNVIRQGVLRGLGLVAISRLPEQTIQPIIATVIVLLLTYSLINGLAIQALTALLIGTIVSSFVGGYFIRRALAGNNKSAQSLETTQAAAVPDIKMRVQLMLVVALFLRQSQQSADPIILASWLSTEDVGTYALALRVSLVALLGTFVSEIFFAPRHAVAHENNDRRTAIRRLISSIGISLVMYAAATIIILTFVQIVLDLANIPQEIEGRLLWVLLASQLFAAVLVPVGSFLTMCRQEKSVLICYAIALIAFVGLIAVLVPQYGLMGAAYAKLIASALATAAAGVVVIKELRRLGN